MIKKYNLMFSPTSKQAEIIQLSQQLYSIADTYKLGSRSFPHVTLCQFYVEDSSIESIWFKANNALLKKAIHLKFVAIKCVAFNDSLQWVFMMPDRREQLFQIRQQLLAIMTAKIKPYFDPHLTLINTRQDKPLLVEQLQQTFSYIEDEFKLALGDCDEVGQVTRIILQSN